MRERRTAVLFALTIVIFVVLVLRLIGLQLISAKRYGLLANQNYVKPIIIQAPRGIIYSREGTILADNLPTYIVTIDSIKATTEELKRVAELFSDTIHSYTIKKVPFDVVCKIEENKENFNSVYVSAHPLRRYTYSEIFSHLIGYVAEISKEELKNYPGYRLGTNIGKAGIEKQYEKYLRGKDGTRYIEVDAKGREQGLLSSVSPEPGYDVWLNIDAELQKFAYEIIPKRGTCVAMNPVNGEVLLWVSKPGYNPNLLAEGISSEIWNNWVSDSLSPLLDRVRNGHFPPASVFKLVTCGAALEHGIVTPETYQLVGCNGGMQIGSRKFGCWETHGSLNLMDAIIHSCDVYFYQLGLQLGVDAITTQAKKVGFGTKTGVDLPVEMSGFMPSEDWYKKNYGKVGWGKGVSANISVGQGEILVTPLQILYFVSGIANRGILCTPRIVKKVVTPNGEEIFTPTPSFTNIPWSPKTIEILRESMLGVVNAPYGTGRFTMLPHIKVAGKTGTAQVPNGETHAWFVAFAPYDEPQICIVVLVEHGGMGGSVAAPIACKILKKFFGYTEPIVPDFQSPDTMGVVLTSRDSL